MPSFVARDSMALPRLVQRVYLDDVLVEDAQCLGYATAGGLNGTQAQFLFPARDWDSGKRDLRGAHVRVAVGYDGSSLVTRFSGYIRTAPSDTGSRVVQAAAISILGLADTLIVGQPATGFVVRYPEKAWNDEDQFVPTGWTMREIFRDLFGLNPEGTTWRGGGGGIPLEWTGRLVLGDMAVLSEWWSAFPLGDIEFKQATFRQALDQLLTKLGTITVRESFRENGQTVLELVEIADHEAPVVTLSVARPGESARGTNVLSVAHEESSEGVSTRIIGIGNRVMNVVSITSNHGTNPLVKGWDTELEEEVLKNPECTKRGDESGDPEDETRQESDPEKEKVFRRYLLPPALVALIRRKHLFVMKDNPIQIEQTGDERKNVPIQVWKVPRVLTYNSETKEWTSTLAEEPVLLEGCQHDLDEGVITLAKPAVNLVSIQHVEGVVVDTYEEAVIGITLTLGGERIFHDTGARGEDMGFDHLSETGLMKTFENDSFSLIELTSIGGSIAYDLWIWLENEESVGAWFYLNSRSTWRDDRHALRTFTEGALRESCRTRANYTIQTPFFSPSVRIGDRVRIVGQDDFDYGTHQVMSIVHDLTHDHSTTISTDNSTPLVNSTILDKQDITPPALKIEKAPEEKPKPIDWRLGQEPSPFDGMPTDQRMRPRTPDAQGIMPGKYLTPVGPTFGPEPPPRDMSLGQRRPRSPEERAGG